MTSLRRRLLRADRGLSRVECTDHQTIQRESNFEGQARGTVCNPWRQPYLQGFHWILVQTLYHLMEMKETEAALWLLSILEMRASLILISKRTREVGLRLQKCYSCNGHVWDMSRTNLWRCLHQILCESSFLQKVSTADCQTDSSNQISLPFRLYSHHLQKNYFPEIVFGIACLLRMSRYSIKCFSFPINLPELIFIASIEILQIWIIMGCHSCSW